MCEHNGRRYMTSKRRARLERFAALLENRGLPVERRRGYLAVYIGYHPADGGEPVEVEHRVENLRDVRALLSTW